MHQPCIAHPKSTAHAGGSRQGWREPPLASAAAGRGRRPGGVRRVRREPNSAPCFAGCVRRPRLLLTYLLGSAPQTLMSGSHYTDLHPARGGPAQPGRHRRRHKKAVGWGIWRLFARTQPPSFSSGLARNSTTAAAPVVLVRKIPRSVRDLALAQHAPHARSRSPRAPPARARRQIRPSSGQNDKQQRMNTTLFEKVVTPHTIQK